MYTYLSYHYFTQKQRDLFIEGQITTAIQETNGSDITKPLTGNGGVWLLFQEVSNKEGENIFDDAFKTGQVDSQLLLVI